MGSKITCSALLWALVVLGCHKLTQGLPGSTARAREEPASWRSYWHANLPGAEASRWLTRFSSKLTPEYVEDLSVYSGRTPVKSLCEEGEFLCGEKASGPDACALTAISYGIPFYLSAEELATLRERSTNGSRESPVAPCAGGTAAEALFPQVFFTPESLSAGKKLAYPKMVDDDLQGRTFLPAKLDKLMSGLGIEDAFTLLDVPRDSIMAAKMEETLAICSYGMPAADGRHSSEKLFTCLAAGESIVDYAIANMGSAVLLYSPTDSLPRSEAEVLVRSQPSTLSTARNRSISCHGLMYPYLLYACHVMHAAYVVDVELQRPVIGGSTFHAIAVCHTDTSFWNPAHPAFAILGTLPGRGTICHWLPHYDLVWVPRRSQTL